MAIDKSQIDKNKLYNVKEVATYLEVTTQTIYDYIKEGNLKAQKVGRKNYYIPGSDVLRLLTQSEAK